VVEPSQPHELELLPYDLLQESDRKLSFSLSELLPKLSYPILSTLDRSLLDPLSEAAHPSERLSDTETQDFILRHVFRIASESLRENSDLLHCLLRLHYKEQRLPTLLSDRLIAILRQKPQFRIFPLETIVSDRSAFLQFLQENWNSFARQQMLKTLPIVSTVDSNPSYGNVGTINLPFKHKDVWA